LPESETVISHDYEGRVASPPSLYASDRVGEAALEEIEMKKDEF
jgi:hypothetical protein